MQKQIEVIWNKIAAGVFLEEGKDATLESIRTIK